MFNKCTQNLETKKATIGANQFTIGRTRDCVFTREQISKIDAGIDLLCRAVQHKHFRQKIVNFSWESPNGNVYKRFYSCNQVSNVEVWQRIANFYRLNAENPIAILPCNTRKDILTYSSMNALSIWMNKGYLNQEWFTPIHVASCLVHDLCDNLGFQSYLEGQFIKNRIPSVPFFCGYLVMQICQYWQEDVTDVRNSFDFIDTENYQYFPCSIVFQTHKTSMQNQSANQILAQLIDQLLTEMDALKNDFSNMTPEELARYTALEKGVNSLKDLQKKLAITSLDGMDALTLSPFNFKRI